jgi:hypothetical protein
MIQIHRLKKAAISSVLLLLAIVAVTGVLPPLIAGWRQWIMTPAIRTCARNATSVQGMFFRLPTIYPEVHVRADDSVVVTLNTIYFARVVEPMWFPSLADCEARTGLRTLDLGPR